MVSVVPERHGLYQGLSHIPSHRLSWLLEVAPPANFS
jgi:hypothetical protein